jgi:hypothetical protein
MCENPQKTPPLLWFGLLFGLCFFLPINMASYGYYVGLGRVNSIWTA